MLALSTQRKAGSRWLLRCDALRQPCPRDTRGPEGAWGTRCLDPGSSKLVPGVSVPPVGQILFGFTCPLLTLSCPWVRGWREPSPSTGFCWREQGRVGGTGPSWGEERRC